MKRKRREMLRRSLFFKRFSTDYGSELLSRTREIRNIEEGNEFLKGLKAGSVVGVDVEGHRDPAVSLVQLRDENKNVGLFRTSKCPGLLGVLSGILEDPEILKVMHGSSLDIASLYRCGIRLWGLYDTSISHRVYLYQKDGISLHSSRFPSYRNLCQFHGFETIYLPPISEENKSNSFLSLLPLPEDLSLYSAFDVDHLIDLYYVIDSLIDKDFKYFDREYSEAEIYGVIDPEFRKRFHRDKRSLSKNDLFIRNLSKDVANSSYIYEKLESVPGRKRVRFSSTYHTAHVHFEKRSSAIKSLFIIKKESKDHSSPFKDSDPSLSVEVSRVAPISGAPMLVTNEESIVKIVQILLTLKDRPIILDFVGSPLEEDCAYLDIFLPKSVLLRFPLVDQLKPLLMSNNLTKVFLNTAVSEYSKGVKTLLGCDIKPRRILDLMHAFKLHKYFAFQANPFSMNFISKKDFFQHFGLVEMSRQNSLEALLYVYEYLKSQLLPEKLMNLAGAISQLESDIHLEHDAFAAKTAKGLIKKKLIHDSIFVTSKKSDFESELRTRLNPLSPSAYIMNENSAVVEFSDMSTASEAVQLLSSYSMDDNYALEVREWKKNYFYNNDIPKINVSYIFNKTLSSYCSELDACGFYELVVKERDDSQVLVEEESVIQDIYL